MASGHAQNDQEAAAEAWLRVSDGLVAGIHHALNNRLAALTAVAQVLEMEIPADHPLRSSLSGEADRLQSTVGLLHHLPRGRGVAEPLQLADVLRVVAELFALHHELRDIPLEVAGAADVLPVYCDPAQLTHALLLAAAAAGARVHPGAGSALRVEYRGDAEWVTLELSAEGEPRGDGDAHGLLDGLAPGAAAPLLAPFGGELSVDGPTRLTVRLPTLLAVRKRR